MTAVDSKVVPWRDSAPEPISEGSVSGGPRCNNLDRVGRRPTSRPVVEGKALLFADAQTPCGLLIEDEIPWAPFSGELVTRAEHTIVVRWCQCPPRMVAECERHASCTLPDKSAHWR